MNLGSQLKKIRTDKNLTLMEVAEALDLTASSLSQIENGKITPSVRTLESLVNHYRLPMSEFFRQLEQPDLVVVRASEQETIDDSSGVRITLLASKLENNALESYEVELSPGCGIALKELPGYINGERFIQVITGEIAVATSKSSVSLSDGDTANFKAHLSCIVKNRTEKRSVLFINGTPPVL